MPHTITIAGRPYAIACNLKTLCIYEKATGRNPLQLEEEFAGSNSLNNLVTLGCCMLQACNADAPDFDTLTTDITSAELTALLKTVNEAIAAYFAPQPSQPEKPARKKKGDAPKNV